MSLADEIAAQWAAQDEARDAQVRKLRERRHAGEPLQQEHNVLEAVADGIVEQMKRHESMGNLDPATATALSIVVSALRQAAKVS